MLNNTHTTYTLAKSTQTSIGLCTTPCTATPTFVELVDNVRELYTAEPTTCVPICPRLRMVRGHRVTSTPLSIHLEISDGSTLLSMRAYVGTVFPGALPYVHIETNVVKCWNGCVQIERNALAWSALMRMVRRMTTDVDARRLAMRMVVLDRAFNDWPVRRYPNQLSTAWLLRRRTALRELLPAVDTLFSHVDVVDTVLGPVKVVRTLNECGCGEPPPWLSTNFTVVHQNGHVVWPTTTENLVALQQVRTHVDGTPVVRRDDVLALGHRSWRIAATVDHTALLRTSDEARRFEELVAVHMPGHGWAFVPPNMPDYPKMFNKLRKQAQAISELAGQDA